MATHSSVLAWRIPGTAAIYGVAQSRTRLKGLSSSSSSSRQGTTPYVFKELIIAPSHDLGSELGIFKLLVISFLTTSQVGTFLIHQRS